MRKKILSSLHTAYNWWYFLNGWVKQLYDEMGWCGVRWSSNLTSCCWYCCCFARSMFILLLDLIASSRFFFLKKNKKKERARTKCRFFPTQTFVAAILLTMRWQKIFCDSDTAHKVQRSWRSISTLHRPFWDDGYKSSLFLPRESWWAASCRRTLASCSIMQLFPISFESFLSVF